MPKRPESKPHVANFSSGPCAKRPGYDLAALQFPLAGRSHRSGPAKKEIAKLIADTRALLEQDGLPKDYVLGMVPGSDTGAIEMAMWGMLGLLPTTVIHFESFGKGWWGDAKNELKLPDLTELSAPYGELPNLSNANWAGDVVFCWNGTTSGVRVPNGDWIPADRAGLTLCDATSAVFAQSLPWDKLDVVSFSWQKSLGSEGAHGMLVLSPRAVQRLETFNPGRPLPKVFRLTAKGKFAEAVFKDSPINTPSMLVIADMLDALDWAHKAGGYATLVERANRNVAAVAAFVAQHAWVEFLAKDEATRSNTSCCLMINDLDAAQIKELTKLLDLHDVAYDIGSYRDAPPGIRIWCGPTVETSDVEAMLPWLAWAHDTVKEHKVAQLNIVATDGLDAGAVATLERAGHKVTKKFFEKAELLAGALAAFDAVILRSATKLPAGVFEATLAAPGNKLKVVARAGVGVDNIDVDAATRAGLPVFNAPASATHSVVELALGHLLAAARFISRGTEALRAGKWTKNDLKGHELKGKNLGFVGFGRIGQALAAVAHGLGMQIHYFDPYLPAPVADTLHAQLGSTRHDTLVELFRNCTHITVHALLTDETRHMINYDLVKQMPGVAPDGTKCGNHLVSCARGGVVDEDGMCQALADGTLGTLALDVFEKEPLGDSPLLKFPNFSGTPHIGASTHEGQARVGAEIASALISYAEGEMPVGNVVNRAVLQKQ